MTLEEPGFPMLYGHLHPLVLHFSIALLLLAAVLEVLPRLYGKEWTVDQFAKVLVDQ